MRLEAPRAAALTVRSNPEASAACTSERCLWSLVELAHSQGTECSAGVPQTRQVCGDRAHRFHPWPAEDDAEFVRRNTIEQNRNLDVVGGAAADIKRLAYVSG